MPPADDRATSCHSQVMRVPPDPPIPACPDSLPGAAPVLPPPGTSYRPLIPQQSNAVELLVLGHTDTHVAKALGLHRGTVARWRLYHPVFQAELARRRQAVWGASKDQFRRLLRKALRRINRCLDADDPRIVLRAASALLRLGGGPGYAPPDVPHDPTEIIDAHVLKLRNQAYDFKNGAIYDSDRKEALDDLCFRSNPDPADRPVLAPDTPPPPTPNPDP